MAKKGRGGKRGRQPNQGARGRAGIARPSPQNLTASGANGAVSAPTNSRSSTTIPTIVISGAASGNSFAGNQVPSARDGYLTPPPRVRCSPRPPGALSAEQMEEMVLGAGQLMAKPSRKKLFVTINVALPEPLLGFKEVDPSDVDIRAIFSQVAKRHQVRIGIDEDAIMIKAANRAEAKDVIKDLQQQLLHRGCEEDVWRTQHLVHPPKEGRDYFKVVLQPREGDGAGVRAVARNRTNPKSDEVKSANNAADTTEYSLKLNEILNKTAAILRHSPNGMRMRVHFGTAVLDEWKKGTLDYDFIDFERLLLRVGTRGTSRMLDIVSDSSLKALKSQLFATNGGIPQPSREFINQETKPVFSIILQTKNLHIESVLEFVQAQGKLGSTTEKVFHYSLGPLDARQQEKRDRAVEIVTVCPESSHDWAIEIVKVLADQKAKAQAPFSINTLEKQLRFTGETLRGGFPNFVLMPGFVKTHEIQKVHGRGTWTYTLSCRYSLKITLNYKWQNNNTSVPPTITAALTLYSDDWDDDMRPGVTPPREWDIDFSKQFLKPYSNDEAPGVPANGKRFSHFLAWVHWIQKALDGGAPRHSNVSAHTNEDV